MKLLRFFKRELSSEAAEWIEEGIITSKQASQILQIYGAKLPSTESKQYGYYVLLSIAALFVGLAVIVFVSANWDQVPRLIRMVSLVTATIILNCIGLYFFKTAKLNLARIWFFLGSLVYGITIFLIAQIFHLGEHYPDGVLLWAIGVLPIAHFTDSALIMVLGAVLSTIWLYLESSFGIFPAFYAFFAFSTFWFCFKQRRSLVLFLMGIVGSIFFGEIMVSHVLSEETFRFRFGAEHVFFTAGVFILLHWLGGLLETCSSDSTKMDYGLVLHLWIVRLGILVMFVFSFEEIWRELIMHAREHYSFILSCTIAVPVIIIACIVISVQILEKNVISNNIPTIFFALFYCLCNLLILLEGKKIIPFPGTILQALTNAALLMTGIWLIVKAYKTYSTLEFYMGVGVMLVTALLRYIDLIGDYVGGSIVFLVAGFIVFTTARLWKRHLTLQEQD